MSKIPKLGFTLDRFNQGCSFFQKAISAWNDGNLSEYETALRKAATEAIGALEWTLKVYLRSVCGDRIAIEDEPKLRQPNFNDLIALMQKYADPVLETKTTNLLYGYRDLLRNAAEHDASIPPSEDLYNAIQKVRQIILTYLPVKEHQLKAVSEPIDPDRVLQMLREAYFDLLRSRCEYMDLGGISPRVGGKVVKIRMEDLFIPLRATKEEPLLESLSEESYEEGFEFSDGFLHTIEDLDEEEDDMESMESSSRHFSIRGNSIELTYILEKPRVVVLGHPGSGKTTVGKYIAYSIASEKVALIGGHLKDHIPVIVKAAEYGLSLKKNSGLSFYDYITQKHTIKFGSLFKWALEKGLALMIIDGLDEIADAELRITTARKIEQFVSEFRANRFLVTSRIVGYRQSQLAGDFAHFTLSEFDWEQILGFIGQWYKAIGSEAESHVDEEDIKHRASELWKAIQPNPGIRKLAGNPLLLTIIVLANWRGTKLPNKRVELYQIATETLIENWPLKQRGLAIDSEEILAILAPIAYHIFSSGKNNLITEYELRPLFESQVCEVRGTTLGEAKILSRKLLQMIEEHTGFFLERGLDQRGQSVYGFLHLTFTEYLAARFLAEQWSGGHLDLSRYVHNSRWHEVLLLMAGHIGTWAIAQATRLVEEILALGSQYEEQLHRDLLLAAEILGDNVRVRRELQDKLVSWLISLALSTPHMPLWQSTVYRLVDISTVFQLGNPATLLQFQENDDVEIRIRKAILLALIDVKNIEKDEILHALLQGLTNAKTHELTDPFVHILDTTSDIGNATHQIIIQKARSTSLLYISERTAKRILNLQSRVALYNIQDLIESAADPLKRSFRVWFFDPQELLKLGASKIASLITANDRSTYSILNTVLASRALYNPVYNEWIRQATSKDASETRLTALNALNSVIGDLRHLHSNILSEWVEAIQTLILSEDHPIIRAKALRVLSYLSPNPENWMGILHRELNDFNEVVRSTAVTTALRYGAQIPSSITNKLRELLVTDAFPEVRQASARVLIRTGKFKEDDIMTLLKEGFGEPIKFAEANGLDTWLDDLLLLSNKADKAETLYAIGTQIKKILESEITRGDVDAPYLYFSIGRQRIRYRSELAEVVSVLFDSLSSTTRYRAVILWSKLRSKSTPLAPILPLIKDVDHRVRSAAIGALHPADVLQDGIIDTLLEALMEDNPELASSAAWTLSRVREPEMRGRIATKVAEVITQSSGNKYVYMVLWRTLVSPVDWFLFDL